MTVTRRITITYDTTSDATAREFEEFVAEMVEDSHGFTWLGECVKFDISGQAFSAEPVIPPAEPLVDPGAVEGMLTQGRAAYRKFMKGQP